jgi:hypothetical protein
MLRLWIFAPNGAVTNQHRATPSEHVHHQRPSPVRAKQNSVLHGDSDVAIAENCRALTGHALPLEYRFPERCPGLACHFPFGAEYRIAQHQKRARPLGMNMSDRSQASLPETISCSTAEGEGMKENGETGGVRDRPKPLGSRIRREISGRVVRLCLQLFIRYPLFFVPSVIFYRYRPFTLNRPQTPCAFVRFGAALLTVLSDRERC